MFEVETIVRLRSGSPGVARPNPAFRPAVIGLESRELLSGMVTAADTPPDTSALETLQQLYNVEAILAKKLGTLHVTTTSDGTTHYSLDYTHKLTQRTIGNVLRLQAQINQIASGFDATSGSDPSVADAVGNINVISDIVTSFAAQASAHLRKKG